MLPHNVLYIMLVSESGDVIDSKPSIDDSPVDAHQLEEFLNDSPHADDICKLLDVPSCWNKCPLYELGV